MSCLNLESPTFHLKNPALQDSYYIFNWDCERVSQLPNIIYAQVYNGITSSGVYYLNERGIQLEYCMHICKEIRWNEIDRIERRTIDTGAKYPFGENEIFFILKKGCSEKEKKQKREVHTFMLIIGNELC